MQTIYFSKRNLVLATVNCSNFQHQEEMLLSAFPKNLSEGQEKCLKKKAIQGCSLLLQSKTRQNLEIIIPILTQDQAFSFLIITLNWANYNLETMLCFPKLIGTMVEHKKQH